MNPLFLDNVEIIKIQSNETSYVYIRNNYTVLYTSTVS